VYTSPNGFKFVKKTVCEGILPMIETELLAARKRAKKQMKEAKTPLERSVYDGETTPALESLFSRLTAVTHAPTGKQHVHNYGRTVTSSRLAHSSEF